MITDDDIRDVVTPRAFEAGLEHQMDARLEKNDILLDGKSAVVLGTKEGTMTKVLLQIFSANAIGPIFFEFIQRKGDEGFGEGNFRALFVSIEEDQLRRGVLDRTAAE